MSFYSSSMTTTETPATAVDAERADILETLTQHRYLFLHTVEGLTDEQAARRTTVSELCLGGLVKHVTFVEAGWAEFVVRGTVATETSGDDWTERAESFRMLPGETLAAIVERFGEVTRRTDELLASLPDLNLSHALPEAPWFEPGARWTARRVFLHLIAEMTQHAGHADILREAIDGQKSMG